ncbi:MAG: DEAD/DEAH box helicase, partial [Clostridia bacterium]|nr:DEAD/DEAH box helicase [Clostridia bacterium]
MKGISVRLKEELNRTLHAHTVYAETLFKIHSFYDNGLTLHDIGEKAYKLRQRAFSGQDLEALLPEVYALTAQASALTLGLKPHDCQLLAAIALHEGYIIQMQTGEGKTLSAVFPAILNALTGRGVHILTFNDYLAKRDAEWMLPLYKSLGLSVGYISESMGHMERKRAYYADVTYVSAKEAGFDYLRDFLSLEKERVVLRGLNYAIVDEADSLMIDEARIPLVISGRFDEVQNCAIKADGVMRRFRRGTHFDEDQYANILYITDAGYAFAESVLGIPSLFEKENTLYLVALHASLTAHHLLKRDKNYIVRQDRIEIIDEFTGRVALRRLYPDSVQAAVEIKEGLKPQNLGRIMGRIAIQHFLSLYEKLGGMTGTAKSASFEFKELYKKSVMEIEPHKPSQRTDHPDRIFCTLKEKEQAILDEILRIHQKGQPVLIGTGCIEEFEELSSKLRERGVACEVLNARHDDEEAHIIAEAGKPFKVTVSTNMAGRGVDIRLGGSSEAQKEQVMASGGLYILGTRRYESVRIDDQLKGRAGRQGEPGESQFFVSLEDELIVKYNIPQKKACQPSYRQQENIEPFSRLKRSSASLGQGGEITDKRAYKELKLLQKHIEGYYSDVRMQLIRYSVIL